MHYWRLFGSSYRKVTRGGIETTTTEFRLDALSNWAIRRSVWLVITAKYLQLIQFHPFQCSDFFLAMGPSIKCVRSKRKGGSQDKSIQFLFYDAILLFKSGQDVAAYVLYEWFPWSLSVAIFTKRESKFRTGKHMSVAEWTNTSSIHDWMCFSSHYRKLDRMRVKTTTTEFSSGELSNWATRSWVRLVLAANYLP